MKIGVYIKESSLGDNPRTKLLLDSLRENGNEIYSISVREDLQKDTDIVLSLGGDGTFLSASKRVADSGVPIFGVNFGRLGFLSECSPEDAAEILRTGSYTIENRTMLKAALVGEDVREGIGFWPYALNEVTVHRQGGAVLGVRVTVDDQKLPTYWADGLLVATSSGSTAYSLSVGGPICAPESKVLIIAPISPHNLNVRPLIVPDTAKIRIGVESRDRGAMMSMDNRNLELDPRWEIEVCMAQFSLKRIRPAKSNFVNALTSKLFWGEDIRNNG